MKTKNQFSLSTKYWLIIIIGICVVLILLSAFGKNGNTPLKWIVSYTVVPMQKGINTVGTWLGDLTDNFETLEAVRKENALLQEKVIALQEENSRLQRNANEYEHLLELYQLDQQYSDYDKVGARIIGSSGSNWFSTITIDKGSNDGIRVDMNVIAGNGLVGIVTETAPTYSIVRSIIDDVSRVGAMTLTTREQCVVYGDIRLMPDGKLRFENMENSDSEIQVGEPVVTSHLSSQYLQGIQIGAISEINVAANKLTRTGYIVPAVDFSNLQTVFIITTTKNDLITE